MAIDRSDDSKPWRPARSSIHHKRSRAYGVFGLALIIIFLWTTPIFFPLKMLVVLFHEISHGLAANLTGGTLKSIEIDSMQAGTCWSAGGNRMIVASAGYLGSLLWGGVILVIASRTRWDRILSAMLGILIIITSVLFVRPFMSFGFLFSLAAGVCLFLIGLWKLKWVSDLLLKVIGLTSCLYAPLDIASDLVLRDIPGSDAYVMSEYTGISPLVWGISWGLISIICACLFLWAAAKGEVEDHFQ